MTHFQFRAGLLRRFEGFGWYAEAFDGWFATPIVAIHPRFAEAANDPSPEAA